MLAKNELNCSYDNRLLACRKNSLPSSRVERAAMSKLRHKQSVARNNSHRNLVFHKQATSNASEFDVSRI